MYNYLLITHFLIIHAHFCKIILSFGEKPLTNHISGRLRSPFAAPGLDN